MDSYDDLFLDRPPWVDDRAPWADSFLDDDDVNDP